MSAITKLTAWMLLSMLAASVFAQPMRFDIPEFDNANAVSWAVVYGDKQRIFASGEIDQGAAQRLRTLVEQRNIKDAIIYFDSPGGSLIAGLQLGRIIRSLNFSTAIRAYRGGKEEYSSVCASACAYAFAGGVYRYYNGAKEKLGLHQFYATDRQIGVETVQEVSGLLVAYLQKMGVDALSFSIASQASSDQVVWLSEKDAINLRFANNGVLPTTAEIKVQGANAYLRLEEISAQVTTRILLSCETKRVIIRGGIVTTPATSREMLQVAIKNYLEFDNKIIQQQEDGKGANVIDSTIWVTRLLSDGESNKLLTTESIGVWLESGGALRWGAYIRTANVRKNVQNYIENCKSSQ